MRRFLSNLVRDFRTAKTARTTRRAPRRANLQVECLEQRDMPAVTFLGGAVLSHVEVQPLYLGQDWAANTTLLNQTIQFNGFLNTIVNSPYMDMLSSAYGSQTVDSRGNVVPPGTAGGTVTPPIGRGTFAPADLDAIAINKTQPLTDSQIQNDIKSQINVPGGLQMPITDGWLADPNRLYVVFVEPGVEIQHGRQNSVHDFLGYHGAFGYDYPVDSGNLQYTGTADLHYAVISYDGSSVPLSSGTVSNASDPWLSAFDNMTLVASHELAEAVTDPDIGYTDAHQTHKALGWFDTTLGSGEEVGDIAANNTVYLYGQYAVQRIGDHNDQAMTPLGARATSAAPMDFVLRADGTFWVRDEALSIGRASAVVGVGSNSGFVEEATGVASISDQGVDIFGQAFVDVVFTSGNAAEYHAGSGGSNIFEKSPWVPLLPLPSGTIVQAKAGQGVSYVLTNTGNVYEYTDAIIPHAGAGATLNPTPLDSNVRSIDAGTDAHGVNMVTEVRTDWFTITIIFRGRPITESFSLPDAYERSDSTGSHSIATDVLSVSAGQQGNIAYVTSSGVAYWYSESTNSSTYEASGVAAITAGTDNSGYLLLDMLFTNGNLSQSQGGRLVDVAGQQRRLDRQGSCRCAGRRFQWGQRLYGQPLQHQRLVFPVEQHQDGSVMCRAVDEKRRP